MDIRKQADGILEALPPPSLLVNAFRARAASVCDKVENSAIPLTSFLLSALAIMALRQFLEDFSDNHLAPPGTSDMFYPHSYAFFIAGSLTFVLLLHLFTKRPVPQLLKLFAVGMVVLLVAPVIDLLLSGGKGFDMSYYFAGRENEILARYVRFFGPLDTRGITPGQKAQIALIIGGSATYVYVRTGKILRTVASLWCGYTVAFLYAITPMILHHLFRVIGVRFAYSDGIMLRYYTVLLVILGTVLAVLHAPRIVREIIRDSRPTRLSHIGAMFILGIIVAVRQGAFVLETETIFGWVLLPASIFAAMLFSIISNNRADIEIDKVTNAGRPHVRETIDDETYRMLGVSFLFLSLATAAVMGMRYLVLMLAFISCYAVYSLPPFRLKRVPFFSKTLLATPLVIVALTGYHLSGGHIPDFPPELAVWMLIGFTAMINVIDIKDISGDRKNGIQTIPVLFGRTGKAMIAVFFLLTYASVALLLRSFLLLPFLLAAGALQTYLILRKRYRDPDIFAVSFICFVGLLYYIATFDTPIIP